MESMYFFGQYMLNKDLKDSGPYCFLLQNENVSLILESLKG